MCILYEYWWVKAMLGAEEGQQRRQSGNRGLVVSCLIAEALIDKIQHEPTSHNLSLKKDFPLSHALQTTHI